MQTPSERTELRTPSKSRTLFIDRAPTPGKLYGGALRGIFKLGAAKGATIPRLKVVRPTVKMEREHIARYGRVCGFPNEALADRSVPLTFPHVLAFPLHMLVLTDHGFPWPAMGMIHLSNNVHQHRAMQAGETVRIEVETGPLVMHEKGQAFTLVTRVLSRDETLWSGESVYLKRGVRAHGDSIPYQELEGAAVPLERGAGWSVPEQLGRDYARVSSDFNPIHLHALSARAFGFRRAIAHGMWTFGRALGALHPKKAFTTGAARCEFKKPLFLPSETTFWSGAPSPNARELHFEVRDAGGTAPHLRGDFRWDLS